MHMAVQQCNELRAWIRWFVFLGNLEARILLSVRVPVPGVHNPDCDDIPSGHHHHLFPTV